MSANQMPAFDQLPKDVRVMLTTLKFNWKADHVLILHAQGHSAESIRRRLVQMEEQKHRADAATGVIAP